MSEPWGSGRPAPRVIVLEDPTAVAEAVVQLIIRLAAGSTALHGCFRFALAGGETPRTAYELLATHASAIRWDLVDVFFSDERCVPSDDPNSNQGMARTSLLSRVEVSEHRIHAIDCRDAPAGAALRYESDLRRIFATAPGHDMAPAFDATMLGIGADGHTASLFPGDPAVAERERWVLPVHAPAGMPVRDRVTLTLPILNRSRHVLFMVTGMGKRAITRRLLADEAPSEGLPAALVRGFESTTWFLDRAAAPES